MARVNYNAIMLIGGFLLLAVTFSFAQVTGEIRGVVLDASGGEPLARVQVELVNTPHRTVTDSQGRRSISELPGGDYDLRVATVGYRLLKRGFSLEEGQHQEIEVILTPDTRESVASRVGACRIEIPLEAEPARRSEA